MRPSRHLPWPRIDHIHVIPHPGRRFHQHWRQLGLAAVQVVGPKASLPLNDGARAAGRTSCPALLSSVGSHTLDPFSGTRYNKRMVPQVSLSRRVRIISANVPPHRLLLPLPPSTGQESQQAEEKQCTDARDQGY